MDQHRRDPPSRPSNVLLTILNEILKLERCLSCTRGFLLQVKRAEHIITKDACAIKVVDKTRLGEQVNTPSSSGIIIITTTIIVFVVGIIIIIIIVIIIIIIIIIITLIIIVMFS